MSETLIGKLESLERGVKRIRETWKKPSDLPFEQDHDKQDVIILNLQRACENLLDICNHLVRIRKLGWPKDSPETFVLLEQAGLITAETRTRLKAMIGMRNIMVHRYQDIDLKKVEQLVEDNLDDLLETARTLINQAPPH